MNIRLKKDEERKVLCSDDIYGIMQKILLRENKIDRNREHLWTISLDTAHKVLNIELVSMGRVNKLIMEPMECSASHCRSGRSGSSLCTIIRQAS